MKFFEAYELALKGRDIRPINSKQGWTFQNKQWFEVCMITADEAIGEWEVKKTIKQVNFIEAAKWCEQYPNTVAWKVNFKGAVGIQYKNYGILDSVGGRIQMQHIEGTYEVTE